MLNFFIRRPKFAMVIALIITLTGAMALQAIPVEQFPQITPPVISVSAIYPGASARDVAEAVGGPVEAQLNGVSNMLYMESTSSNNGSYQLSITFASGTDPDMAAVEVQNRLSQISARLPAEVNQNGIAVRKRASNILMSISVLSPGNRLDALSLSNYASVRLRDALARIHGVGDVQVFGARDYSMRIWLDPHRMEALNITTDDVMQALRQQNVQAAAGQIGAAPTPATQQTVLTVSGQGRLLTPEAFAQIVLRSNARGGMVRIGDIASTELGAQNYQINAALNNTPGVFLMVYPAPAANALSVAKAVRAEMAEQARVFPQDMAYQIKFDATTPVTATLHEIALSLLVTLVVVLAVVWLFLQSLRATFIVALTIPVSLLGTFAVLLAAGYSANTLSLFAIILALTIVVDDAIVVVENVERLMMEEPLLSPAEATRKALGQIAGPVIATTLVLLAVFVPTAVLPGIVGELYRQFAVTLSASMVLSSVCALTLTPALCACLLRRRVVPTTGPLASFNRFINRTRDGYVALTQKINRYAITTAAVILAAGVVTWMSYQQLPDGFLPQEDEGYLFINVQLPEGAALPRTQQVMEQMYQVVKKNPAVADVIKITGFSLLGGGNSPDSGFGIVLLKAWHERPPIAQLLPPLQQQLAAIPAATIMAFVPPPVSGLGNAAGFDLRIQALEGQSPQALAQAAHAVITAANQHPQLSRVFTTFSATVPEMSLTIDRERAALMQVPVSRIVAVLQTAFGGSEAGDFTRNGRQFRVQVQNEMRFRQHSEQLLALTVRSDTGAQVRLNQLVTLKPSLGAPYIMQYNQFPSLAIGGGGAQGVSSGQAMQAMTEVLAQHLPEGYEYSWSGMSYQEQQTGNQAVLIYLAAVLFAWLFMVAQYESWSVPLAVMLSVVFAAAGAVAGLHLMGFTNDVYAQIGLVLLMGLAAKNAILLVEFARDRRASGVPIGQAAKQAASQRFRAVMMTAISFIVGVLPLVMASGAGAASRRIIGITVFSGMLAATLFGILFIPALWLHIQRLREWRKRPRGTR